MIDAHEILRELIQTSLSRNYNNDLTWGWIEECGLSTVEPELARSIEEFIRAENLSV